MYTEKERAKIERQLARIEKCKGDCKHCQKCQIETRTINERCIVYAFGCMLAPDFSPISDTMTDLHKTLLETLRFELS